MFGNSETHRHSLHPRTSRFSSQSARRPTSFGRQRRPGLALTELLLIILVPCFSLLVFVLFDSELKKSLLAGPDTDSYFATNPVYDAIHLADDTVLTVHSLGELQIWDLAESRLRGEIQSHLTELRCAAYSKTQKLLAVGSAMGKLEIWDLDHPDTPLVIEDLSIRELSDCQFIEDGNTLLTAGEDGQIVVWNSRTLARLETLTADQARESIRSLAVSPDGKYVAAGTNSGIVQIWNWNQRQMIHSHRVAEELQRPDAGIESITFLADNRRFIAATRNSGVAIWNLETGECVQQLEQRLPKLRSGILSEDESHFIGGSEHGRLVTWNLKTGVSSEMVLPNTSVVRSLASNADGTIVLSGDWNGRVQVRHCATGYSQ